MGNGGVKCKGCPFIYLRKNHKSVVSWDKDDITKWKDIIREKEKPALGSV